MTNPFSSQNIQKFLEKNQLSCPNSENLLYLKPGKPFFVPSAKLWRLSRLNEFVELFLNLLSIDFPNFYFVISSILIIMYMLLVLSGPRSLFGILGWACGRWEIGCFCIGKLCKIQFDGSLQLRDRMCQGLDSYFSLLSLFQLEAWQPSYLLVWSRFP